MQGVSREAYVNDPYVQRSMAALVGPDRLPTRLTAGQRGALRRGHTRTRSTRKGVEDRGS